MFCSSIPNILESVPELPPLILLTGASGYVGGRLLVAMRQRPVRLRCLARNPEYLRARCGTGFEIVGGDVLDPASLETALQGVDVAYYLVHSMGSASGFEEQVFRLS